MSARALAMALGVPVVSTPVAGIPEIIEDGVSGVLVPPADSRALAETMATLLEDPSRRKRLAIAGWQKIERRFNRRMSVPLYLELFRGSQ